MSTEIQTLDRRPVIFGEVLFDRFPGGEAVLGGAPFNVAWHLQAFGAYPLFISSVGVDEDGMQIRRAMQQWKMDLSGLQSNAQYPTGVVNVSLNAHGEPSYHIKPDSAWDYISYTKLPAIPSHSLLYHGSLVLRQVVSHTAWQWLKQHAEDTPRFIDINLRPPWFQQDSLGHLLEGSQWLKLNASELAEIVPQCDDTHSRIRHLLDTLPLQWIIVTQGEAGAIAVSAGGESLQVKPEQSSAVVDSVGAGDAFSSVVLLGLVKGWPMQQTLENAQQFASAVVGLRGATSRDQQFYQPFIDAWQL